MKWFRLYSEARNDAKLRYLTDSEFRVWFNLLCFAAEQVERGAIPAMSTTLLSVEVASGDRELLESTLEKLQELQIVFIDEGDSIEFVSWQKRQYEYESDKPENVRKRVKRHRERQKKRRCNDDVTSSNENVTSKKRAETPPDTDPDTDPDTEVPVLPPNPPSSKEGRTPADPLPSDPMQPVTQFLVTNLIPTASPYQVDRLAAWAEDDGMEPDLIIWAMEQALLHGQRHLSYVEGILRRCRDQGITTRKAAEYAEAERIEAQARGDPQGNNSEAMGTPIPIDMDELDRLQKEVKELMASGIGDK
jgi:DnaD/phage-associated family protein